MATILTVFFSMTGQTWADGSIVNLKKGFTNIAADYIHEAVGGEIFQIRQKRQYAKDHFVMIEEAKEELQHREHPELLAFCNQFQYYDTIFLCYPNWWGTLPSPVITFLTHYNWTGKRVIPFVTSGGSGFGASLHVIQSLCKGAEISNKGLAVLGTQVEQSKQKIEKWACDVLISLK